MRRAHMDVGWLLAEDGRLLGLNLGYDGCAEHEQGIKDVLRELGVPASPFPLGIGDRMVTRVSERLQLQVLSHKPRDKRRKAYPTAMLSLLERWELDRERTPQDSIRIHELDFYSEPYDKWHDKRSDVAASWGEHAFAVHVRGDDNIARLKELKAAFDACDIAIGLPWAKAFFRGGIALVIASRVPEADRQAVLAQDRAHLELHQAAEATGIHKVLEASGKRWYALAPSWFDSQKDEVLFFLNPCEQHKYQHGWFTVEELTQWAQNRGPVMRYEALEAFAKRPENYDWNCRLLRGMHAAGVKPRHHEHLVWADEAKTVPGLQYRATRDSEALLPSGVYPFAELMARFAEPLPQAEAQPA